MQTTPDNTVMYLKIKCLQQVFGKLIDIYHFLKVKKKNNAPGGNSCLAKN